MNVIAFPDRLALGAKENLANLVARARALHVFGPSVDFEAPTWNISHLLDRKPGKAVTSAVLYFTKRQAKPSKKMQGRTTMAVAFAEFLKAMIAMRQMATTPSFSTHQRTVIVARFLYDALAHCGHDIIEARSADFNVAASLIKRHSKRSGAYNNAYELERIAAFINKHQLSKTPIRFSNPLERVDTDNTRVDEKSRKERSKKLPPAEYIAAVVEASLAVRGRDSDSDLARMSVLEQLACAPWRINGVLGLRAGCERWEHRPDGTIKFGIAHGGSKEAPDDVKPIPTRMVPIAERSLADLHRLTQPSRDVAKWIEEHPGRAWLPDPWRLRDRSSPMSARDVAAAMGFTKKAAARLWMKSRGQAAKVKGQRFWYTQGQLEDAILSLLPEVPKGRRLSEYLLLFPRNYFHTGLSPLLPIPTLLTQGQMRVFLVGTDEAKSIGRVIRGMVKSKSVQGRIAATVRKIRPADREDFLKARFATAHTTDIGMCTSDWSLAPCASHGACAAGCGDHMLVKGDQKHLQRARQLLTEHEAMLEQAREATAEGALGAGPWVEHNEKMVVGLRKAVAIHQDPEIPDGTLVQP